MYKISSEKNSASMMVWVVLATLVVFFFAFLPLDAKASEGKGVLMLTPTNQWVAPGQTMTVKVQVNAQTRVNALEGAVTYPKDLLTATGVSTDGTVVNLWAVSPTINATEGTVRFAGGVTGGLFGSGDVFSIVFKAQGAGTARVTIEDSSVLAHDGLGTPVTGVSASGRYTVQTIVPNRVFLESGDLIKLPDDSNPTTQVDTALYYYGKDGLRYVFPNSKTYFTWYNDFKGVKVVSSEQLGTIGIGGNVTYRPGVKMIKIDSDPKVYAVGRNGALHWVKTEALAISLYGAKWNTEIHDVADSFFTNYEISNEIATASEFIPVERAAGTANIAVDKDLAYPIEVFINSNGAFTPAVTTVGVGRTVRFTNIGTGVARVKATGLAGLDSAYIPTGLDYVYRFKGTGNFGIYNAGDTSKTGTIVAQ